MEDRRCVYILKGKRYYVGSTNDLERRLIEHESGYSAKRIGDWECVGYIACEDRLGARQLEVEIKKSCHPERYIEREKFVKYEG